MTARIVYSPEYDLYLPLLEGAHPFEGRKYSRAYKLLKERFGTKLDAAVHLVQSPAERTTLG